MLKSWNREKMKTNKEKQNFEIIMNSLKSTSEYRFHDTRKWRFDYAIVHKKIAFEFEGGVFTSGGHTRGAVYSDNCDKYNEAQRMGWKVYRFTTWHFAKCRVGQTYDYIMELVK